MPPFLRSSELVALMLHMAQVSCIDDFGFTVDLLVLIRTGCSFNVLSVLVPVLRVSMTGGVVLVPILILWLDGSIVMVGLLFTIGSSFKMFIGSGSVRVVTLDIRLRAVLARLTITGSCVLSHTHEYTLPAALSDVSVISAFTPQRTDSW